MLAQKLIFSYSNQIVIQIFQIAASLVVARVAGASVLGTITFALSYVTMFSFVADLGFGTAHIKKLSEGLDAEKGLGTYSRIKLALIALYTITVICFFLIQKYILKTSFESNEHIYAIFIFLISAIITQTCSICKTTFTAYAQQAKTDLPDFLSSIINQILRIALVLLGFRVLALSLGNLASVIAVIPFYFYLFRGYKLGKFDILIARDYWKIAKPVMITAMTSVLFASLGIVILQFYTNSEQVGYYSAGFRIGGFVLLISFSIGNLFFPIFSRAAANKDYKTIVKYMEKFERFSFIYLMPVIVLVTLFANEIVRLLLGKEFSASVPIMMMINISMFFRVLTSPYGSIMSGFGLFNQSLQIGIIQLFCYLILLFLFTNPNFMNLSGYGAALAYLLSTILLFALYIIYSKKNLKMLYFKNLLIYLSFALVNFGITFLIYQGFNITSLLMKACFAIIYLFMTYLLMYSLKLFKKEDLQIVRVIFDFKAMNKYINQEIRRKQ